MTSYRRCVGRDVKRGVTVKCPVEARTYCQDKQWRCGRHAEEYRRAHPDISERSAIQGENEAA